MTAIINTYIQASRWTQKQIAAHPRIKPLMDQADKVALVAGGFSYLNYVLGTSWTPSLKDVGLLSLSLITFFLGRQNSYVITPENLLEQAQDLKTTILRAKTLPTYDSIRPRLGEFFTVLKNQGNLMPPNHKTKAIKELIFVRDTVKALPIEVLWTRLEHETYAQLKGVKFFPVNRLPHRFPENVFCPEKSAIVVNGSPLHANRVGDGITKRIFIASQAPLVQDYERFWQAAFAHSATIIDLTTKEDELTGGVTKYYPTQLGKTVKYGSMLVTLAKMKNNLFLYKVTDTKLRVTRDILRFRYDNWKDFSAVNLSTLQMLVKQFKRLVPNVNKVAWIHCRAGLNRTGTLISAVILEEKIKSGEITRANLDQELGKMIVSFRKQRGPGFVQIHELLDLLRQFAYSLLG